jgi:hypothetical protein
MEKGIFLFNSPNETVAVLIGNLAMFKANKLIALGFSQFGYASGNSEEEVLEDAKRQMASYNPQWMTYDEMNKMRKNRSL